MITDALSAYFKSCADVEKMGYDGRPTVEGLEFGEYGVKGVTQAELDRLWAEFKARKAEPHTPAPIIEEPVQARIDRAFDKVEGESKTQKGKGFTLPAESSKRYNTGTARFDSFNWFADRERRNLTPAACEVWFTLWGHADSTNRVEKVSAERIAVESNLDLKTVEKCLTTLVKGGYLTRLEPGRKGKPTVYRVLSGRNTPARDGV